MTPLFSYTPEMWPPLFAAFVSASLAAYVWPRRHVPGGLPFFAGAVLMMLSCISQALLTLAVPVTYKVLFRGIWTSGVVWAVVTSSWRSLDYAGLMHRVPRFGWILLCAPAAIISVLALTNQAHHLVWQSLWYDDSLRSTFGPGGYPLLAYSYFVFLFSVWVTLWVCVRSHGLLRLQAGIVTLGTIVLVFGQSLEVARNNGLIELSLSSGVSIVGMLILALALFRFRAFDLAPVGRHSVVEHMQDGMFVLDAKGRVVDINPAAARLISVSRSGIIGQHASTALRAWPCLAALTSGTEGSGEALFGQGPEARVINVDVSALRTARGEPGGQMVICRDVTDVRRAQATVERQRLALATVTERERLGRELHDGLAQVLAYVKMQVQATNDYLEDSTLAETRASLAKIETVLQDVHEEVRDFLLGIKSGSETGGDFRTALTAFVRRFSETRSFAVQVAWRPDGIDFELDPVIQAELLRITQESLVNASRHAGVSSASIDVCAGESFLAVVVKDEGVGFDPHISREDSGHYGLRFMRERAEAVGGSLIVVSEPGCGAEVRVSVPLLRKARLDAAPTGR